MPASEDLFMSDRHPISKRWAIVEEDGRVAWLYLTEPGSQKPAADCWLYNRVPTPPQFDSARGEMPVVPATHAASGATRNTPLEKSVYFRWAPDGESVAVLFDSELMGFIAHAQGPDSVETSKSPDRSGISSTWSYIGAYLDRMTWSNDAMDSDTYSALLRALSSVRWTAPH
jgi:hypothetical protein